MTYEEKLDNVLLHLREQMLEKFNKGKTNISEFGEFGMLVRASDDVDLIKEKLLDVNSFCEDTEDTWMKLAELAAQSLVLFHSEDDTDDILTEIDKEDEFNEIAETIDEMVKYPGIRLISF